MTDACFQTLKTEMKKETLDLTIPNHMSYRDYRETPASPSSSSVTTVISAGDNPCTPDTPDSVQDEPGDQTLVACPDSPPGGNLFNKKDERIHNDLLDELCTDMGLKDAMELDFFDEMEENYIDQFMATEDYSNAGGSHSGLMSPVSHASSTSQESKDANRTPRNMTPSGSRMQSAAPSPERERKVYENNPKADNMAFKSPHKPPPRSLPQQPLQSSNPGSQSGSTPSTPTRKSVTFAGNHGNSAQRPPGPYQGQGQMNYQGQGHHQSQVPTSQSQGPGQMNSGQGQMNPSQGHSSKNISHGYHGHAARPHHLPMTQQQPNYQQHQQIQQSPQYNKGSVWNRSSNTEEKPKSTMHYKPPAQPQHGGVYQQSSMEPSNQPSMQRYPIKQEKHMHNSYMHVKQPQQNAGYPPSKQLTQLYNIKREGLRRSLSMDNHSNYSFDSASVAASDIQSDQGYTSCDLASTSSRPSSRATTMSQYSSMESIETNQSRHYSPQQTRMQSQNMPVPSLQKQQSLPAQLTHHVHQTQIQCNAPTPSQKQQSKTAPPVVQLQQHPNLIGTKQETKTSGLKSPLQKLAELNQSITDDYNQHIIEKSQTTTRSADNSGSDDGMSPPLEVKVEPPSTPQSNFSMADTKTMPFTPTTTHQTAKQVVGHVMENQGDSSIGSDPLYPNRPSIKRLNNGTEKSIGEIEVYSPRHHEAPAPPPPPARAPAMDWNNMGAKPKQAMAMTPSMPYQAGYDGSPAQSLSQCQGHSQPNTPCGQYPAQAMQPNMWPNQEAMYHQGQGQGRMRSFQRSNSFPAYTNDQYAPDQTMQFCNEGPMSDYSQHHKGYPTSSPVHLGTGHHGNGQGHLQKQTVDLNQNMPYPHYHQAPMQSPHHADQIGYSNTNNYPQQSQSVYPTNGKNYAPQAGHSQSMQNSPAYSEQQTVMNENPPPYNYTMQSQGQGQGGQNGSVYISQHNSPGHYAQSHTPPIRHHPYQGNSDRSRQPPSYNQHYQSSPECGSVGQSHQHTGGYGPNQSQSIVQVQSQIDPQFGCADPNGQFPTDQSHDGFDSANQFTPIQTPGGVQLGDIPPPDWPPTHSDKISTSQHSFMQRIVSDKSSAFRSHPLFPLLRDLIVADMNFHNSSFPYQLISSLPTDFNRLLQNYLQRTPPTGEYQSNQAIDSIVMDSLKYAHMSLIEKIQQKKDEATFGQSTGPMSAIEDFCSKFDQAVRNSIPKDDGHRMHMMPPHPDAMGPGDHGSGSGSGPGPGPGPGPTCTPQEYYKEINRMNGLDSGSETNNNSDADSIKSSKSNLSGKVPGEVRKHPVLPKEAVAIMLAWLKEHREKPYPSDEEKSFLMEQTKLTINQINYWFVNARRRILPKWKQLEAEGKTITLKTK